MEELEKKLKELKEFLEKGMNNVGLGGAGSVKSGAVLPSISKLPKAGNNSLAGKVKIPNATPATKKSPVKSAEQTHNKDIKDIKMKEAHAHLAIKPMAKEEVSIAKNGQWNINKSHYTGYSEEDNARRKASNITSEEAPIQAMKRVKAYGNSAKIDASREASEMKAKSKKNPVKVFSSEEIKAINEKKS